MFADGNTNLFCKSKVVKTLFLKANIKFEKKFIMVSGKQTFFKQIKLDSHFTTFKIEIICLCTLAVLKINNYKIKRSSSMNF